MWAAVAVVALTGSSAAVLWDGANSRRTLSVEEAVVIASDPDADEERRRNALGRLWIASRGIASALKSTQEGDGPIADFGSDLLTRLRERLDEAPKPPELPIQGSWEWDFRTGIVLWDEDLLKIAGIPAEMFSGRIEDIASIFEYRDREHIAASIDAMLAAHRPRPADAEQRKLADWGREKTAGQIELEAFRNANVAIHIRRPDGRIVQLRSVASETLYGEKDEVVGQKGTLRRFGEIKIAKTIPLTPIQPPRHNHGEGK